ncbi:serine hydrolase [Thermomicrobium sp. 4228-Ro]|uniref:D-alanyl-D-alanine carboxypeptidase family protein n=1 Tax=Thermomicrobium sp. 4228-Ro TaxID=2993937 RepID=UPI00224882F8|nr:serine hydrolase [Thermomicrobium sp. 4228-Ro]MCX2728320.1 serine hydrolase [Thermomicrobium sp. 4228-Ro]
MSGPRKLGREFGLALLLLVSSIAIAGITLARFAASSAPTPSATLTMEPPATPTPTPTPLPTPTPPPLGARAILVVDLSEDHVLLERESRTPLPPASTLKLLTALTVKDILSSEEIVTVAREDVVDPAVESSMGLAAGDTITVHDLLIGLLLPSGNDAARTLARVAGERLAEPADRSPQERFLSAMQEKARALGLEQTVVRTPDGDDVPEQTTSAADLVRLARAVLADPELSAIVALRQASVRVGGPNARVLELENTNELLGQLGIIGVKTGTTPAAGQCLVAAWRTVDERLFVAVLLGSQDRYSDLRTVIQWVAAATGSQPIP